jgi:hypothetical protein
VRDGEKVALLRELLRRVQTRADREYVEVGAAEVGPSTSPTDPWVQLSDDTREVLSGRILERMRTIPPPRPDDSGLIERWTELLERDVGLVEELGTHPMSEAIVPLPSSLPPSAVAFEPPAAQAEFLPEHHFVAPVAASAEHPKTSPPGHFENSISAAIEALDEPSLLRGAETDLRVRPSVRPILPRSRRRRTPTPTERREPSPGVPDALATARSALTAPDGHEPAAEEDTSEAKIPQRSSRGRWALIGAGGALVAVGLHVLARDEAPTRSDAREFEAPLIDAPKTNAVSTAEARKELQSSARTTPSATTSVAAPSAPPLRDPATYGWLRVESQSQGRVYVQGIDAGPTGVALEVRCGLRNVRVAHVAPPPPGSSFPAWIGESKSVVVPCGAEHRAVW